MSRMRDELTVHEGIEIPAELEAAWRWMEEQGHSVTGADGGYFVTPYPGTRQLGPVFSPGLSLTGWVEPGRPGFDRLVPIAEVSGDGSLAALWRTDTDQLKVVFLGSDGGANVLAESAMDFLRLIAVGYLELDFVGGEPDEPDAVEAIAGFRAWLKAAYDVTVPDEWPDLEDQDEFSEWIWARVAEGGR